MSGVAYTCPSCGEEMLCSPELAELRKQQRRVSELEAERTALRIAIAKDLDAQFQRETAELREAYDNERRRADYHQGAADTLRERVAKAILVLEDSELADEYEAVDTALDALRGAKA